MSYATEPGRYHPYNTDGTVVKWCSLDGFSQITLNSTELGELNDEDFAQIAHNHSGRYGGYLILFFPEQVEFQGLFCLAYDAGNNPQAPILIEGSSDSANGFDGTWESASAPGGYNATTMNFDSWRSGIKSHTFSAKRNVIRIKFATGTLYNGLLICHLYAKKGSGETPDDLIFLDAQASDAEFAIPLDYGDQPAGTTTVRQIKIKNTSGSTTFHDIDVQVNSTYFTISLDNATWDTQITISSLAPGTKSAIIYVRCVTPDPPTDYKPVRNPLFAAPAEWA